MHFLQTLKYSSPFYRDLELDSLLLFILQERKKDSFSFFVWSICHAKISDPYSIIDDEMVFRGTTSILALSCTKKTTMQVVRSSSDISLATDNMFMLKNAVLMLSDACLDWWCNNRKGRRKWKVVPVCEWCFGSLLCISRKVSENNFTRRLCKLEHIRYFFPFNFSCKYIDTRFTHLSSLLF